MPNWKTRPYTTELHCVVAEPKVIFQARVNEASALYPFAEFTYDSADPAYDYTNIRPGMTLHIGTTQGASDLGKQRVRAAFTATTAYVGWSSLGVHPGELTLTDDAYITVYEWYEVWAKVPRILSDGTIYKDFDILVSDNNSATPPVANGGPGVAKQADPLTGKLRVTLPPDSNTSFATIGGILTYAWELPASGATLVSGNLTDAQIVVDFDPSQYVYYAYLTVTDTNAKTHTCSVPIYVGDGLERFTITNHTIAADGQSLSIELQEKLSKRKYPAGTLVMVWEEEYYNSINTSLYGPTGREHMRFIGWFSETRESISADRKGLAKSTVLPCLDVAGKLKTLPSFSQLINLEISPTTWTEMSDFNIDKYYHYLLYWHSTALEITDFQWSGLGATKYFLTTLGSDQKNLYAQVQERTWSIRHIFTCDTFNRLGITENPLYPAVVDRTSTVQQVLTDVDYKNFKVSTNKSGRIHWIRGASIVASLTDQETAFCIAPGAVPGQGAIDIDTNDQLVFDQTEINTREGNNYAIQNRELLNVSFELVHSGSSGIEPAYLQWVTLSLDEATRRNLKLSSNRFLPTRVSISYSPQRIGVIKKVTVTCEPETIGNLAEIVYWPVLDVGEFSGGYGEFNIAIRPLAFAPPTNDNPGGGSVVNNNGGWVADTGNFVAGVGWQPACVSLGGLVEFLDITKDIDGPKTLKSITVTYTAVYSGGATGFNSIETNIEGQNWQKRKSGTTVTGTDEEFTVTFDTPIVADNIRVVMYAGGADCDGSLTITNISYEIAELEDDAWSFTQNLLITDGGWTALNVTFDRATYDAGQGWGNNEAAPAAQWDHLVQIELAFASAFITSVDFEYTINPNDKTQLRAPDVGGADFSGDDNSPSGGSSSFAMNVITTGLFIGLANNTLTEYTGHLTSITINGSGFNPFI